MKVLEYGRENEVNVGVSYYRSMAKQDCSGFTQGTPLAQVLCAHKHSEILALCSPHEVYLQVAYHYLLFTNSPA